MRECVHHWPSLMLVALGVAWGVPGCGVDPLAMDSRVVTDAYGLVPDLVCPGAPGCESGEGRFRVGVAKRVITPEVESWEDLNHNNLHDPGEPFVDINGNGVWDPVWIAGFERGRAATGVHDDLWVRAMSISKGDVRMGIVVADLLGLGHDDVVRIRRAADEAKLGMDHVLVVSTHNHQAKDSLGFGGQDLTTSGYDPVYMQRVVELSVEALAEAAQGERRARLEVAVTEAPALVGDSRQPFVIDQALHAVQFVEGRDVIASLIIWGNHAEALGGTNTLISADYPHYLRASLEARYPGSMGFFMPGNLGGLINPMSAIGCPDANGQETCPTGTFPKAEYIGVGAAQAAIAALRGDKVTVDNDPALAFKRRRMMLGITNFTVVLAYKLGVIKRGLWDTEGELVTPEHAQALTLDEIAAGAAFIQSEVNAITLGPLMMVTVPGELYPELWLSRTPGLSFVERPVGADFPDAPIAPPLVEALPDDMIKAIVNQGNDAVGYIIPQTQWDFAEPFAYEAEGQYGEGVSLGPTTAPQIDEALRSVINLPLR